MTDSIDQRLIELGLSLPKPAQPVANYVPFVQTGSLITLSGQIPMVNGSLAYKGVVGKDLSVEEAKEAAKICLLNLLAVVKSACGGDLNRVKRVVKLGGFLACDSLFTEHAAVMNGASDLVVGLLGEKGRHARSTVGVSSLPLGAPVEIDGVFEIES